MNVLRALADTLEHFESFSSDFDEFVYFFEALFSFRTRPLEMDRSLNRNNIFNGFEEEKEKDDQYHHHHHQVGRRFRRRRKAKASLFRETRLNSSVFRIIVSDLNFKISALVVSPKISVL